MYVSLHSSGALSSQQALTLNSQQHSHAKAGDNSTTKDTDHVLNQLAKNIPGIDAQGLKALKAEDFTPEKVSDRIANYVAMGLEQARRDGKSDAELQNIYDKAVSGIEKGFKEARDILKGLDVLSDDLSKTIDETFQLTQDKVAKLAPQSTDSASSSTTTSISAAERYQSSQSFSLNLKTQDGDKVTIEFSGSSGYQASLGAYDDGQGSSAAVFNIDRNQSSNYSFSVKGELDQGEIDSIQNLIQDVSVIANDFFGGDIQSAFSQASQFQLDKSELSSMRLTLTQTQQYASAAAYQQVQDQGQQNQAGGRKLGHLLQDLKQQYSQPQLAFIQSAQQFTQSLFNNLVQQDQRYAGANTDQQQQYDNSLATLQSLLEQQPTSSATDSSTASDSTTDSSAS